MSRFSRYLIRNLLYASGQYAIYTSIMQKTSEPVLLKKFNGKGDDSEEQAQLRHEYQLLESLNQTAPGYFPKLIEYIQEDHQCAIVIADEGYRPLSEVIPPENMTLELFFKIAIQAAEIISKIHLSGIIHKNIIPHNLFYHTEKGKLQIHDFSIATELSRIMVPIDPPRQLQGTLEYMAPEQTGRMNRPLTQKADLYSLGIIFYEYLTGSVPFKGIEPMAIISGHIGTIPRAPHEIKADIPRILSDIVMKLLSKSAGDRYKSAIGLSHDLLRAQEEFLKTKTISSFSLAQNDIPVRLELPDKIYGREKEIAALNSAFDELRNEFCNQVIAVSGYSGIGKTCLVRELIPKITLSNGFFSSGKFNKFQQSDAYEGLRSALDHVVRYHLNLPESEYQVFKNTLLREMGGILRVATDFIPRLTEIVGVQDPLPEVGIEETRNRFELAIGRFVKIASQSRPLAIFLDDMQYANPSLFALLQKIVTNDIIQNFLLIVSYRSNEINEGHPLRQFFEEVEKKRCIEYLELHGLSIDALGQLLQDMFCLEENKVVPLAQLLHTITEGNPFFLLMLLETLYRDGDLQFDYEKRYWVLDEAKIASKEKGDITSDFIAHHLSKYPDQLKNILYYAACIGNTFTIEELTLAKAGGSAFDIAEILRMPLQEGLLIPTKLNAEWIAGVSEKELFLREYRFQHDRIQQCCYEIKKEDEREKIHLDLARNWYRSYENKMLPIRLMAIADQFNRGINYITDLNEKLLVCRLNFEAGKIALESAAYEAAYQYDSMAKSLLPANSWKEHYPLVFGIFSNYIKSAFLSHHFIESEEASKEVLQYTIEPFDKAKLLLIKGDLTRLEGKTDLSYYEEGLHLLGYPEVAKQPNKLEVAFSIMQFRHYISRDNKTWQHLPKEAEKKLYLAFIFMTRIGEECVYRANLQRYTYIATKFITTTFADQDIALRAFSYGMYATIWPHKNFSSVLFKRIENIIFNLKNKEIVSSSNYSISAIYLVWHKPFKDLSAYFRRGIDLSEQVGNLEAIAINFVYLIYSTIPRSLKKQLSRIAQMEQQICSSSQRGYLRVTALKGFLNYLINSMKEDNDLFKDTIFERCREINYKMGELCVHALRMAAMTHAMNFDALIKNRDEMWSYLKQFNNTNLAFLNLPFNFYLFLLEIDAYINLSITEKLKSRARLYFLYRRVKSWIAGCPENFLPYFLIIKAENSRLKGNLSNTLALYDAAIETSNRYRIYECLTIASQRALKLCVDEKEDKKARVYADKAVNAYSDWGALAIVEMLQRKYGELLSSEWKVEKVEAEEKLTQEEKMKREEKELRALSLRNVILSAEATGKEIQLENLLKNVMQLLVDNIGATRIALCITQKGTLYVESSYNNTEGSIQNMIHTHWKEANLSQQVLLAAWLQKKEYIIVDALNNAEFNNDSYFAEAGTKCLIAMPIIHDETVIGVIYCENNSSIHAFTPERIDILHILAKHLSVALNNSRFYTTLKKFTPSHFLKQLGQEFIFDIELGDSIEKHTHVLWIDLRNIMKSPEKYSAPDTVRFINEYFMQISPFIHRHHGFINSFFNNGVIALFPTNSDDALRCCLEIQNVTYNLTKQIKSPLPLKVGMALHYGPLMLGIVDKGLDMEGTIVGDTIDVTERLAIFNKLYPIDCIITDSVKKGLVHPDEYMLRQIGQIMLFGRRKPIAIWQVLAAIGDEQTRNKLNEDLRLFEDAYGNFLDRRFEAALKRFQRICQNNPDDNVAKLYCEYCRIYQTTPPPNNWQGELELKVV